MTFEKPVRLSIKNMVCHRCVLAVENILDKAKLSYIKVGMGEVLLNEQPDPSVLSSFESQLKQVGFELIESRANKIVEDIKILVIGYLNAGPEHGDKLSTYITNNLPYDYSYLSDLFSSIEGRSIEQFFITLRIDKVKELIVYDQLSLTEIAHQIGFSSVHHLSAQFKKVSGLTPSEFKRLFRSSRSV